MPGTIRQKPVGTVQRGKYQDALESCHVAHCCPLLPSNSPELCPDSPRAPLEAGAVRQLQRQRAEAQLRVHPPQPLRAGCHRDGEVSSFANGLKEKLVEAKAENSEATEGM